MSHQNSTLQARDIVHRRARRHEPLSDEEVEEMTRGTAELAGAGTDEPTDPNRAQWLDSANRALRDKPASKISRRDASELHRREMKAFQNMPAQGSVASHVQSQADRNEVHGSQSYSVV